MRRGSWERVEGKGKKERLGSEFRESGREWISV